MFKIDLYEGLKSEPTNAKWLIGIASFQIIGGLFALVCLLFIDEDYLSIATPVFGLFSIIAGILLLKRHNWGYVLTMTNLVLQVISVDLYGHVFDYTLWGNACVYFSLGGTVGYHLSFFHPGTELRDLGIGNEMIFVVDVVPLIIAFLLDSKIRKKEVYEGY